MQAENPESSFARKETVDIGILTTSMDGGRENHVSY